MSVPLLRPPALDSDAARLLEAQEAENCCKGRGMGCDVTLEEVSSESQLGYLSVYDRGTSNRGTPRNGPCECGEHALHCCWLHNSVAACLLEACMLTSQHPGCCTLCTLLRKPPFGHKYLMCRLHQERIAIKVFHNDRYTRNAQRF